MALMPKVDEKMKILDLIGLLLAFPPTYEGYRDHETFCGYCDANLHHDILTGHQDTCEWAEMRDAYYKLRGMMAVGE